MSARYTSLILLALCFCLLVLMAVLAIYGTFSGMHIGMFQTPQMIEHTSRAALAMRN